MLKRYFCLFSLAFLLSSLALNQALAIKDYSELSAIKIDDSASSDDSSLDKELSLLEAKRAELKKNEQSAFQFINASTEEQHADLATDEFFTHSEKEQLLELWRATLLRNRSIQFILKSLAADPKSVTAKNNIMQALTKAMFVPFYAVSAVADNTLITGGSLLGARVIGDVVDKNDKERAVDQQITRTDMVVMFMLVDEVAERLRQSYYQYKDTRIKRAFLDEDLQASGYDLTEALDAAPENGMSEQVFLARMINNELQRQVRLLDLDYRSSRRMLIELAGEQAVANIDPMIDVEIREVYNL
jgi:vacuolar-type H+-ATPase subunit F/Vma7